MDRFSDVQKKLLSQSGALNAPWNYLLVGMIAALMSVAIYAGVQYQYQTVSSSSATTKLLDNPMKADSVNQAAADAGQNQLKKTSESFRAVAKKLGPAVVSIKSSRGTKPKSAM